MIERIGLFIFQLFMNWFKLEKSEEYKSEAAAAKEALNSVGDSINLENKIKEKLNDIDNQETKTTESDALGDNEWNNNK